jgi:hypothetical protein
MGDGTAERIWIMDRSIPTEETLAMRQANPPVSYLVGPQGAAFQTGEGADRPALEDRAEGVEVKLLPQQQELCVLAQSHARINQERAMRRLAAGVLRHRTRHRRLCCWRCTKRLKIAAASCSEAAMARRLKPSATGEEMAAMARARPQWWSRRRAPLAR